ncbi:MAG: glycosyltransferase [Clostridiales bacterium]|nr:glycosyltransferase [Clostridiales bacterium]
MQLISFIIPCYASEGSVALVMDEIRSVVAQRPEFDYEIIAVNDCSPDGVWQVLCAQADQDPKVKAINLAKNGGRHNAPICGCHYARGEYVVLIDDDQQCPCDRLWDLMAPVESGAYDAAFARYPKKTQSALKNFGSKVNDLVSNWLLEKDKDLKFSNFTVMRQFIVQEMIRYQNPYPYISGLIHRSTSRIANVDMEERERTIGVGHYTFKKSFALWMNNLTAFSVKPLRLATTCGVLCALIGVIMALYTVIHKLLNPAVAAGYSSMMAVILFLGGMVMFMLGLIGEYIGRIYISLNNSPQYVIRESRNLREVGKDRDFQ